MLAEQTDRLRMSATSQRDALARCPLPFEASVPGLFAGGDVRSASVKRVDAAVGEIRPQCRRSMSISRSGTDPAGR